MLQIICDFLKEVNLSSLIWRYYLNEFEPDWKMESMHLHGAFEIIAVLDGYGTMSFSKSNEKLATNNCLMIMPNVPHQFFVDKDSITLVNIHINCEKTPLGEFLNECAKDAFFLQSGILDAGFLKIDCSHMITETLLSIVNELENKEKDYETVTKLLFGELFLCLIRIIIDASKRGDLNKKSYIRQAKQYIEHNLAEELNPNIISNTLHLSAGYLMHIFKDLTSQTLMDYVHSRRLERSKVLLLETDETITSIASKIGISNSQYFSVVFKAYCGKTPREFRKYSKMKNNRDFNIFK